MYDWFWNYGTENFGYSDTGYSDNRLQCMFFRSQKGPSHWKMIGYYTVTIASLTFVPIPIIVNVTQIVSIRYIFQQIFIPDIVSCMQLETYFLFWVHTSSISSVNSCCTTLLWVWSKIKPLGHQPPPCGIQASPALALEEPEGLDVPLPPETGLDFDEIKILGLPDVRRACHVCVELTWSGRTWRRCSAPWPPAPPRSASARAPLSSPLS